MKKQHYEEQPMWQVDKKYQIRIPMLLAVLLTGVTEAKNNINEQLIAIEKQIDAMTIKTSSDQVGVKLLNLRLPIVDDKGWTFGLGALYQKPYLPGMAFGYTDLGALATDRDFPFDGDLKKPQTSWGWGVEAFVGYYFSDKEWELELKNSYFNSSHHTFYDAGFSRLIPLQSINEIPDEFGCFYECKEVDANLKIGYDLLELDFKKGFYVSRDVAIEPSYGLLSSWMWLENRINYEKIYARVDGFIPGFALVQHQSDWFGLGPQAAIGVDWVLGSGFSIYTYSQGALLIGSIDASYHEEYSEDPEQYVQIKDSQTMMIPYLNMLLGLAYRFQTEEKLNTFLVKLGYQLQAFIGANQFLRPGENYCDVSELWNKPNFYPENNHLWIQGVTLDISWSF
jgi:hypothetical protein